jgi:hypothetical protein
VFKGAGAPPSTFDLPASAFQRGPDEIKACVGGYVTDADLLAREIVELEAELKNEDREEVEEVEEEETAEDEAAVEAKREKLAKVKKDIGLLEAFYKDTNSQWGDIARRNIDHVNWAPMTSVDV